MSNRIQVRRGSTADRMAVVPENGEPVWDTESQRMYVGDGVTPGGVHPFSPTVTEVPDLPASKITEGVLDPARIPDLDASGLLFDLGATGSVGRTVESKLADVVSAADFGVVGDGVTDDTDALGAFIDAAHAAKKTGVIPRGTYLISALRRRSLTNDLRIVCGSGVKFVGAPTKQDFAGNGALTSFLVTVFDAGSNGFCVSHVVAGVQTLLTKDVHYTVSGQTINTAGGSLPLGAVATGNTLRVVSANGMIELGAASAYGCSIDWEGGYIDASARGSATNTGSGSGMVFYNARRGSCRDVYLYASADWEPAVAAGLGGDSGVTTIACNNFKIESCVFVGWADLGIYATGNSSAAESDDGYGVDIDNCGFIRCQAAASVKRGGQASHIHNCWARECNVGFSFFPAGISPDGARGSIHDNFGIRMGRLFVDVRSTKGVSVHDNTCIDIGYAPDGTTVRSNVAAFNFSGVERGTVHDNVVMLQDWALLAQRGIVFGQDSAYVNETVDCTAHHNKVYGMATGISESGAGTGNVFRDNEIVGCTTPMSVLSARRWHYRTSNIEYEGIGATAFAGAWTPAASFANGGGSFSHTTQFGRYVRRGNTVTVWGRLDFTPTHSETTSQFRIQGLPYSAKSLTNEDTPGVLSILNAGFTWPTNTGQITPKIPQGSTYVRLDALLTTGTVSSLTGAQVASGVACRVDFQLTYECAEEALN